jgi:hypothetical protein
MTPKSSRGRFADCPADMEDRLFSYIVRHDFGFAPNPFHGYCTLATCKPQIRSAASVGDWVIGTGSASKNLSGRLVYAMQVSEKMSFDAYWADERFRAKVPVLNAALKHVYGDNIYHRDTSGVWIQEDSRHSLGSGEPNPGHIRVDTGSDNVLVSTNFVYFGGSGPEIPAALRAGSTDVVHDRQGHRSNFPVELVALTENWILELGSGVQGRPHDWPNRDR